MKAWLKGKISAGILSIIVCVFLVSTAQAQTAFDAFRPISENFGPGARALALGGAYSSVADDYTATYWNPAGLAQIRKMELYLAMSHTNIGNDILFSNITTSNSNGYTKLNSIGMVFPVPVYRGSLVFAFGYNRIQDFDNFNDLEGTALAGSGEEFYVSETTKTDGSVSHWVMSSAVDVTENLSLGASLNIWSGEIDDEISALDQDLPDIYTHTSIQSEIAVSPEYTGVGAKFGALFRPNPDLRFAINLTTPTFLDVEESSSLSEEWIFDPGEDDDFVFVDDSFRKYDITTPWTFGLGASYRKASFLISADVELLDWSQADFSSNILDEDNRDIDIAINQDIKRNYKSTTKLRVGAEYLIPQIGLKLMGGYFFSPSNLRNELENSDKNFVSGGLSFLVDKQVKIDLAYQRGWWKQATTDAIIVENAFEDITTNKFVLSLAYRF